jgi:hydroxyacylglutathione hydrolase
MNVLVLPTGPLQTNAYLLTVPARKEAVLIDAPLGVWPVAQSILKREGCALTELWLTHGHFDHMEGGAEVLKVNPGLVVRAHPADRHLYEQPERMRWFIEMFLPGHPLIEPVHATDWVQQGTRFSALGMEVEVRHVPGHADGNVVFYLPDARTAFVGDSIFAGGVGRTDLPGGSFDVLAAAIKAQLFTLDESTVLFPGHGPKTTVGVEKRENPYLQ